MDTIIKAYGVITEKLSEIEKTFDWRKILSFTDSFEKNEHNQSVFTYVNEGKKLANVSVHDREIQIHPNDYTTFHCMIPMLEKSLEAYYDARCCIRRDPFEKRIIVYLYQPDNQPVHGIKNGDSLLFGTYPQGRDGEVRPIQWRVLDISGDTAYLLSDLSLIRSGYCDSQKAYGNLWYLMWGNSLAREVCCGQFFHQAFSMTEQKCLLPVRIDEVNEGPDCSDTVFLLSEPQVRLFMPDPGSRISVPSEYLLAQEGDAAVFLGYKDKAYTSWWLLPEERGVIYPKAVWPDGSIQYHGRNIYHRDFTIRPCICVRVSSLLENLQKTDAQIPIPEKAVKEDTESLMCETFLPEKNAFCEYLAEKAGQYIRSKNPDKILSLKESLQLISDSVSLTGQKIPEEDIQAWMFRRGYLGKKKNTVLYLDQSHIAGNVFFTNVKGFGHPNGKPVILPPARDKLIEHLPELFSDLLVSKAPDEPDSLRLQMEGSRLFFMTFRTGKDENTWKCSFDFEKAEDSHYDLSDKEAAKLISYLQGTLPSERRALAVLLLEYLGDLSQQSAILESIIVKLLGTAGVSYQQFHFY